MNLTPNQTNVLNYYRAYYKRNGIPPTYSEVAEANGVSVAGVAKIVSKLSALGHLKRVQGFSRAVLPVFK